VSYGSHNLLIRASSPGRSCEPRIDRVEHYDVRHDYIEDDDRLAMMRVLMEARPRLIEGMNGLAGETITGWLTGSRWVGLTL
jgi:hypothetical protein